MTNPCPGYVVTTPFGQPGNWSAGYHPGEDYACPIGTQVVAAEDGVLLAGTWGADYGTHVVVDHGDKRTGYCHLSSVLVRAGEPVYAGEVIALSGNTGRSTGPHLHHEQRHYPYKYADHEPPTFSHQEDDVALSDDDVQKVAKAVWDYQIENTHGDMWKAKQFLHWLHDHTTKILERV